MIGKGNAISNTGASISYALQPSKKAEIVHRQFLVGKNPKEIAQEFKIFHQHHDRCKNKTMGFMLSPTIKDGKTMDNRDLKELAQRFLKEMKLEDCQGIAIAHRNREHVHLHLYVNRIDFSGKVQDTGFIGLRAKIAAEVVAKQMGLTTVREAREQRLAETKEIRGEIKGIHDRVILWDRPGNFEGYMRAMKKEQVKVVPFINKQNELQGFRFEYKGNNLKGSEVHPNMAMAKIASQLTIGSFHAKRMIESRTMEFMGKTIRVSDKLAKGLEVNSLRFARRLTRVKDMGMEI